MGKRLFYWELAGALFTAALGTLLHFTYGWSGDGPRQQPFPLSTSPHGNI